MLPKGLPMNREDVRNVGRQRRNKMAAEEIMENLSAKCILRYVALVARTRWFLFSQAAINLFTAEIVLQHEIANTKN